MLFYQKDGTTDKMKYEDSFQEIYEKSVILFTIYTMCFY